MSIERYMMLSEVRISINKICIPFSREKNGPEKLITTFSSFSCPTVTLQRDDINESK